MRRLSSTVLGKGNVCHGEVCEVARVAIVDGGRATIAEEEFASPWRFRGLNATHDEGLDNHSQAIEDVPSRLLHKTHTLLQKQTFDRQADSSCSDVRESSEPSY